jgi:dolichol-phosphate mannosyltransferase
MNEKTEIFLSVVIPVYQSASSLEELIRRLGEVLKGISRQVELILVDDGSSDGSWDLIQKAAASNDWIRGFRLSRNFGQHHAIAAGLDASGGEWTVVMDADLQDLPEEIPHLLSKAQYGYEVVWGRRVGRTDSWHKKLLSALFHRIFRYMSGFPQDPAVGNFGIYHKKVVQELVQMRESIRYFPAMVQWIGFRQGTFDVEHGQSSAGKSNYVFQSKVRLAVNALLAFSDKPLRFTVKLGFVIASIGFIFALLTLVRYFSGSIVVPGYASLIVSIWILSGIILMTVGMVGLYVGKIFEGVKKRPLYVVAQQT